MSSSHPSINNNSNNNNNNMELPKKKKQPKVKLSDRIINFTSCAMHISKIALRIPGYGL